MPCPQAEDSCLTLFPAQPSVGASTGGPRESESQRLLLDSSAEKQKIRVTSPTLKYGSYSLIVKKKKVKKTEIFLDSQFYFCNLNFLGEENSTVNRDLK